MNLYIVFKSILQAELEKPKVDIELQTEPFGDDKAVQTDVKLDCKSVQTEIDQDHAVTQTEWEQHCKIIQTEVEQEERSAQTEPTNITHVATQWQLTNFRHTYVQVHVLGEED